MRRIRAAIAVATTSALALVLGATGSEAHQWSNWSWNRSGPTVTIQVYNFAANSGAANQALNDWDSHTIISLPRVNFHTDISVFDGNYGNTGWGGLATIVNSSGRYITHAHTQLNTYYGYNYSTMVGIFCQEVGHDFGLDHSNDGCMGLSYFNNLTYTVQHNWNDIYNMYRNPHLAATNPTAGTRYSAVWRYHPASVRQAARMGSATVRATVTDVRQAADVVVPAAGEPGGVSRIPTQAITLRTDERLRGTAPATFTLFRTGDLSAGIAEDPGYRVGEQYVLMLKGERADGRSVLLSPEGRYLVQGGTVQAFSHTPAVAEVNGMSYEEFRALVRR